MGWRSRAELVEQLAEASQRMTLIRRKPRDDRPDDDEATEDAAEREPSDSVEATPG